MEERLDLTEGVNTYFLKVKQTLDLIDKGELNAAMNALLAAYKRNANIYCFGNGGSAATASHMMNDFNKGVSLTLSKKFRFHCLNDNMSIVTALANDIGYPSIFQKQLEGKITSNDLVVAISGSGNSPNVIRAVEYAKSQNCKTVGITGYDGGQLRQLSDYYMHVPSFDMQVVEDVHMIFNHMMMKLFCHILGQSEDSCNLKSEISL